MPASSRRAGPNGIGSDTGASIGITESNLSLLKSGKVKGVRFSTLAAICRDLECEPGDILGYDPADDDLTGADG